MVKKFASGMHESWLYNPITSADYLFLLDRPPFDS